MKDHDAAGELRERDRCHEFRRRRQQFFLCEQSAAKQKCNDDVTNPEYLVSHVQFLSSYPAAVYIHSLKKCNRFLLKTNIN